MILCEYSRQESWVEQWQHLFQKHEPGCSTDVTPKGVPHLALCSARATRERPTSKLMVPAPQRKIGVTSKTPVGVISVVTLIRTDTTLDHSQKAEKVCSSWQTGLHQLLSKPNKGAPRLRLHLKKIVYTSRFVRVILAQGPC